MEVGACKEILVKKLWWLWKPVCIRLQWEVGVACGADGAVYWCVEKFCCCGRMCRVFGV